jgi:hypothetical protein
MTGKEFRQKNRLRCGVAFAPKNPAETRPLGNGQQVVLIQLLEF